MSQRLDEATRVRITAQNEAGEAKSELVIIQVCQSICQSCFSNRATGTLRLGTGKN